MAPKKGKTKVIFSKLKRQNVYGLAHMGDDTIEVDIRLKGYRMLLYLLHEKMHLLYPDWSETKIRQESSKIARFLWHLNFRRIDM